MRAKPKYVKNWIHIFYAKQILEDAMKLEPNIDRLSGTVSLTPAKVIEACRYYKVQTVIPTRDYLLEEHVNKRKSIKFLARENKLKIATLRGICKLHNVETHASVTKELPLLDRKALEFWYVKKKFTVRQTARKLNTVEYSVTRSMKHYGIKDRYDHSWLFTRYCVEKKSLNDMAAESGMCMRSIAVRMDKAGIQRREINYPSTSRRGVIRKKHYFTKGQVAKAVEQGKTIYGATKILGCSYDTTKRYIKTFEIPYDDGSLGAEVRFPQLHNRAWMYLHRIVLKKTIAQISKEVGCERGTVEKGIARFNLQYGTKNLPSLKTNTGKVTIIKINKTEVKKYNIYQPNQGKRGRIIHASNSI